jgi:hypothetical protein
MNHLAILNPTWHIREKLLSGEKTIETRWYQHKVAPWNRVQASDTVYFKDAGKPVTLRATVEKVEQIEFTTPQEVVPLLTKYKASLGFTESSYTDLSWLDKKQYGILIFLKDLTELENPITFDKTGFGSAAAWLCLSRDIESYAIAFSHEKIAG